MERPEYYGILPAKVRYDERLKPMEKILFSELIVLSNMKGYCYANNSYFAKLYKVHKNTVSIWINNLAKHGYVVTKCIMKDKQVEERRVYVVDKNGHKRFVEEIEDRVVLNEVFEEKTKEKREKTPEELEEVKRKLLKDIFGEQGVIEVEKL